MPITKTQGKDFNFFRKINVTWSNFGGGTSDGSPEVIITFPTQGIMLMNEDASSVVEVSYNGNTVHDELNPVLPSRAISYDNRVASFIWLRLKSGVSASFVIRAWGTR